MSDLSRTNSMKIRLLTSILSGLDNLKTDLSWTILGRLNETFRNSTLILNVKNKQVTLSRLNEVFRNSTLFLNVENDQLASSGLDEVLRIPTLILNDEDDGPSSICLTCLACCLLPHLDIDKQQWCCSHYRFAGGRHLESNPSSQPFRLACISIVNCSVQLSWIKT